MISIKKDIKGRIYVNMDGEIKSWDTLSEEVKKEKATALNDTALRAAGYLPVQKPPETTKQPE